MGGSGRHVLRIPTIVSHRNGTGASNTWHKASDEACSHDDEPRPPHTGHLCRLPSHLLEPAGSSAPPHSDGRPLRGRLLLRLDHRLRPGHHPQLTDRLGPLTGARIVSCALGFLLNRRLFRAAPETLWRSAGGYAAVQGGIAATSYAGIAVLTGAGAPLWLAKVLVDSTLFIVNYLAQSRLVYRAPAEQPVPALATAA